MTDSERLDTIEKKVNELHELFFGPVKPRDEESRDMARRMAVKASLQGDRKAMELFVKRWGA